MAAFTDNKHRTWTIEFTVGDFERLRKTCGVDLLDFRTGKSQPIAQLIGDLNKLGQALWLLIADQAELHQVTPEDFARGLTGGALGEAIDALYGGMIDFFQQMHQPAEALLVQKAREVYEAAMEAAGARIRSISTESLFRQAVERHEGEGKSPSGSRSTGSPANAASIPGPIP
jgi:hypothetical protein